MFVLRVRFSSSISCTSFPLNSVGTSFLEYANSRNHLIKVGNFKPALWDFYAGRDRLRVRRFYWPEQDTFTASVSLREDTRQPPAVIVFSKVDSGVFKPTPGRLVTSEQQIVREGIEQWLLHPI
jgi:hypothetical protein